VLPLAEVVGSILLCASAGFGKNEDQIGEEIGVGVGVEVEDGGIQVRGVWEDPVCVEIKWRHPVGVV
jgi:hypothetical protein